MPPRLHDAEPSRHEVPVGQRGVRGGVRARRVEVRERGRLVHVDALGQVLRQGHPHLERRLPDVVQHGLTRAVDGRGERAARGHRAPEDLDRPGRRGRRHEERDRPEALLPVGLLVGGVDLQHRRRPDPRVGIQRRVHLAGRREHPPPPGARLDPGQDVVVDDGAEQVRRLGVVAEQPVDRCAEVGRELLDRNVPGVGGEPVPGHQQVLRGRAHLPAVEHEREGDVREHPAVVVGRVDDDRVEAGLLRVHLRLPGVSSSQSPKELDPV